MYVIIVVPGLTAVTTPPLLIVATAVLDEVHGVVAAGVPDPVKLIVNPSQTEVGPVIVGCAVTVIVAVMAHALLFV